MEDMAVKLLIILRLQDPLIIWMNATDLSEKQTYHFRKFAESPDALGLQELFLDWQNTTNIV